MEQNDGKWLEDWKGIKLVSKLAPWLLFWVANKLSGLARKLKLTNISQPTVHITFDPQSRVSMTVGYADSQTSEQKKQKQDNDRGVTSRTKVWLSNCVPVGAFQTPA